MRAHLLFLFFIILTFEVSAQTFRLSGKITDEKNAPVPFASIYIRNSTYGSITNEDGEYEFKLPAGTYTLVYRCVGYLEHNEKVTITSRVEERNVTLYNEPFVLQAEPGTGKETDPAVGIMEKVIAKRKYHKDQVDEYSCAVFVKGLQSIVSSPASLMNRSVANALQLDASGKGIIYQSESISKYNFKNPDRVREVMIASKTAGANAAFSYNKASDLQVSFYDNDFVIQGLSSRAFVSPFADNARHFYNYKLVGRSIKSGRQIDKIQVIPKRHNEAVYQGNIYVIEEDWRIYSVDLFVTKKDANINLVDTLDISQQYIPITDSVWLPTSTQFNFRGDVLGFKFKGYYLAVYNNYNLDPKFPKDFFNGEVMRIDTVANSRNKRYWTDNRPVPLTDLEARDYQKKDSLFAIQHTTAYLDSAERQRNHFSAFTNLIFGYQYYDRKTRQSLYLYPPHETIFYNTVEGWGIRLRPHYIKGFDNGQSFSVTPMLRYGFAAKLFSANVGLTYNYDPSNRGAFSARFGSDVLDLNNAGTRSLFFNTLSSLVSERNFVKLYRSKFGVVAWQREIQNGLFLESQLSYAERQQLYNTSFNHIFNNKEREYTANNPLANPPTVESPLFPTNQALTFKASLTYTFRQQYVVRPDGKFYEPAKYPKVRLNYRKGINGVLGSDVNYDFLSLDIFDDHLQTGLLGFSAFKLTAGTFLNHRSLYFMDYNHFFGNQGTVFNPTIGNFHFLPFYTYSTDRSFVEAHYEHNFAGNFLSKIPYIRALKLEELVGVNYLAQANHSNYSGVGNNQLIQSVKGNYTEAYIGVQRFVFRVDYGVAFDGSHKIMQGFRIFYGLR
ncbi:DUF5686 and carboxypeptidase regulatory-like domain-containing protein [Mucilaginibacter daejeonensis]|uniref:DUF5686 and carboxypeptidase regulatory-like domain-containing protein n=1 Tax=Mucilaginibacter daejeonensis TaxID=398049 RepID=UPI001D17271C|nr:DUF5686 and carboxypeptidase regulatory-like domain-containing protein [Mucilaginibacter daejeonensis]UEG53667.1 DUF5686 and carboxypeptidase regulatory-like domain-containing protein [Mucilaginibacter daejeonensis]